jgi:hypothetical protein
MCVGGLLFGDSGRHTWMNEWMNEWIESPRLASGSGYGVSLSVGTLLGNMLGAPLLVSEQRGAPWTSRFSCMYVGGLLFGDSSRHTWMNEWINRIPSLGQWLWWRSIPVRGDPVREHGGGSLTGDTEKDNKKYIKRDFKMPCKRVSLSLGAPLGNLEGIRLPGHFERKG